MQHNDEHLAPLTPLLSRDEQVYQVLLESIVRSQLLPGTRLSEATLARQLGVSKTPVRTALQRLEGELLIERDERNRYLVSAFSRGEVFDLYLVRSRLEGLACSIATDKMTARDLEQVVGYLEAAEAALEQDDIPRCVSLGREFHQFLISKVGNKFLSDSLRRLDAHVERGRRLAALSSSTSHHSLEEHRAIYEAMKAGDRRLAEQRMQEHIVSFITEIHHPTLS